MLKLMFQYVVNEILESHSVIEILVGQKYKFLNGLHWDLSFGLQEVVIFLGYENRSLPNFMSYWPHEVG